MILLIEKDKALGQVLKIHLESEWNKRVVVAKDLPSALSVLEWETPESIIIDYYLDGDTVSQINSFLQEVEPTINVVLISAWNKLEEIARVLNVKKQVKKPFNIEEFEKLLQLC